MICWLTAAVRDQFEITSGRPGPVWVEQNCDRFCYMNTSVLQHKYKYKYKYKNSVR